jgi:hypothetical protein
VPCHKTGAAEFELAFDRRFGEPSKRAGQETPYSVRSHQVSTSSTTFPQRRTVTWDDGALEGESQCRVSALTVTGGSHWGWRTPTTKSPEPLKECNMDGCQEQKRPTIHPSPTQPIHVHAIRPVLVNSKKSCHPHLSSPAQRSSTTITLRPGGSCWPRQRAHRVCDLHPAGCIDSAAGRAACFQDHRIKASLLSTKRGALLPLSLVLAVATPTLIGLPRVRLDVITPPIARPR